MTEPDQVRIIVAYDTDLSLVGTTKVVSRNEARRLIDEGRARPADGDPEDPDAAPAAGDEPAFAAFGVKAGKAPKGAGG